jgi:hypothetical protein
MGKDRMEEISDHLSKVKGEIERLMVELREKPGDFGDVDNRLYWAVKGIDPRQAICIKHNRKLHRNDFGEFLCGDCIYEIIEQAMKGLVVYDEGLWLDPKDKPRLNIRGIKYADGPFYTCLFHLLSTRKDKKKNDDSYDIGSKDIYQIIKKLESTVLDKNINIDARKTLYNVVSDIDPIGTFDLTLDLYRTLDAKNVFKGYDRKIHKKENTEFLLFRKFLRDRIYKYYLKDQKDCKNKLYNLLCGKNLDHAVKKELEDIYSGLTDPKNIFCFNKTPEQMKTLEDYCCRMGITFDDLLESIYIKNKDEINKIIKSMKGGK